MKPILYLVIPCYNEEEVLPITAPVFLARLTDLINAGKIAPDSKVLFVDDGSADSTWLLIRRFAEEHPEIRGVSLSRNRGHQNALLCGLMEARKYCDISISLDADGQDDPAAIAEMVDTYLDGFDVVYGVRSSRAKDSAAKRGSAQAFYRLMGKMGVETVYNHADFRLMSKRALDGLAEFDETDLYLRGMVPLVGYPSNVVYYERPERAAGKTHYTLRKMLRLAENGILGFSLKPLEYILGAAAFMGVGSLGLFIWQIVAACLGKFSQVAFLSAVVLFVGALLMAAIGLVGLYVGNDYMESKHRPRYIVADRTYKE